MFVDLGSRTLTRVRYHVFLLVQDPAAQAHEMAKFMHGLSKGAMPVILVPQGRKSGTAWPEVEFTSIAASFAALKNEIIDTLGIADDLTAAEAAPINTRLIIDRARGEATLDGLVLPLDGQPFQFLDHLAQKSQQVISSAELLKRIAPKREPDAVRAWKKTVLKAINTAFENAKKPAPGPDDIIVAKGGGYLCRVPSHVA